MPHRLSPLLTFAALLCATILPSCRTTSKPPSSPTSEAEHPPLWQQSQDADRARLDAIVQRTSQQIHHEP